MWARRGNERPLIGLETFGENSRSEDGNRSRKISSNPEKPSSERSGWEFMEDQTQKPSKATWQWSAEWENGYQDITMYFLKCESPTNPPLDAKNLQVTALYIPAEIAAKMMRDGEKFKQDRNPKL
jgi:hypothetical protein